MEILLELITFLINISAVFICSIVSAAFLGVIYFLLYQVVYFVRHHASLIHVKKDLEGIVEEFDKYLEVFSND